MNQIIITTQEEFGKIKEVKADEELIVECELSLKCNFYVYGRAFFKRKISKNASVEARGNASVEARGNASVVAWENASVVARGNASVVARGNASVVALGNASVVAWENASVVARENASVVAWENASVVARGNASVVAWENASVVARGNASVVAWENASVVAWENASVRIFTAIKSLVMFGFSVCFKPFDLKIKIKKSKTVHIQNIKPLGWFENNGIKKTKTIILFKKVSKDFFTQEGTENETKWEIGTTVTHPNWEPEKEECGEGKFHACSRPYFCDEFRNEMNDRYIAIQVKLTDVYEWKNNPQYPHKIGFREAKVLREVDSFGGEK